MLGGACPGHLFDVIILDCWASTEEYWSIGLMVCWSNGLTAYWFNGLMVYRFNGSLVSGSKPTFFETALMLRNTYIHNPLSGISTSSLNSTMYIM